MKKGEIVFIEYESQILKNNPLGDPDTRRFPVYLPPSYRAESQKRYPVIFGLTGFTGFGEMYLNKRFLSPPFNQILDEIIAKGCPEMIYVMPDCLTKVGGSQYVNSSAVGNYEDYIVQELVPFIDSQFRTNGQRGCVGGSSGGIGSFSLPTKHPDVFQGFSDHSGDSAFLYCFLSDVPKFIRAMQKFDYNLEKFVRSIPETKSVDDEFMCVLNMVGMSACYSPNPLARPLGFELPFDIKTGELKPEIWKKWESFDPVNMVKTYESNLKKLKFCYVDCGKRDQFHLWLGARQLHQKLNEHGIDHVYEEYDSDHFLLRKEQKKKSIPLLLNALAK